MSGKVSEFIKSAVYQIVAFDGGKNTRKCDSQAEKNALSNLLAGAQSEADKEFIEGFMLERGASKAPKVNGKNPEVNAERTCEYNLADVPVPEGFNPINVDGKVKSFFDENGNVRRTIERDENNNIRRFTDFKYNGEIIESTSFDVIEGFKTESKYDMVSKKSISSDVYASDGNRLMQTVRFSSKGAVATNYGINGVISDVSFLKLDETGMAKVIRTVVYNEDGKTIKFVDNCTYDENGDVEQRTRTDSEGNALSLDTDWKRVMYLPPRIEE